MPSNVQAQRVTYLDKNKEPIVGDDIVPRQSVDEWSVWGLAMMIWRLERNVLIMLVCNSMYCPLQSSQACGSSAS